MAETLRILATDGHVRRNLGLGPTADGLVRRCEHPDVMLDMAGQHRAVPLTERMPADGVLDHPRVGSAIRGTSDPSLPREPLAYGGSSHCTTPLAITVANSSAKSLCPLALR